MYKSNLIPTEYNKIAEFSDNYVVWVKESKLNSGTNYHAYIQYFKPSFWLLETENYKITKGDTYSYDYNYYTTTLGNSYLDSADVSYSLNTIVPDEDYLSDNSYENADFPDYFVCQFIMCIIFLWVIKHLTMIAHKGGIG